jgi:hypothetical protein
MSPTASTFFWLLIPPACMLVGTLIYCYVHWDRRQ